MPNPSPSSSSSSFSSSSSSNSSTAAAYAPVAPYGYAAPYAAGPLTETPNQQFDAHYSHSDEEDITSDIAIQLQPPSSTPPLWPIMPSTTPVW